MLDSPEFHRGRAGEIAVAHWLRSHGYYVIPSYDYAGSDGDKAPRMRGARACYAIPDLDVAKDGRRVWIEVKTKAEPTFYRKLQRWEHGIDLRLFYHYRRVEHISGCPVWLAVLEEKAGIILSGSRAAAHLRWSRDKFTLLARLVGSAAA